jgi:tetratricopeptide (TPR) repeat protein
MLNLICHCGHPNTSHPEVGCDFTECSCEKFRGAGLDDEQIEQVAKKLFENLAKLDKLDPQAFKKNMPEQVRQESAQDRQRSQSDIWDEVEAHWDKIDELTGDGEYDEVDKEIEIILGIKFENISAWIKKGHNNVNLEKYNDAIFCYNNALILDKKENKKLDKKDYKILNFIGRAHKYNNNYDVARNFFKDSLKIKEDFVPALEGLGLSYRNSDEYELAIEQFKKLLSIEENHIDGLDHLGYCYELNNDIDEAIKCYNKSKHVEGKDDGDNFADIRLAKCYFLKKDLEHAELLINNEKITKNETNVSYEVRGSILRDKKEYDQAILNFENAITKYPNSISDWYQLAWCNGAKGNHELALEYYKKSLQLSDNFDEYSSYAIGYELEKLDRKQEAMDWHKQELLKYPQNIQMLTEVAFLFMDLEEYDQAIKYWDKISEITPDDQWIPFRKSFALSKQDKMEQSLQCLEKILIADEQENGPSKAQMMNQKGWYLFKMGKLEESMGWIKKSLAIEPKFENALDSKAQVLFKQEKYDEAGKIYEEIFEIKENDIVKRKIADCKRLKGNQIKNDEELKEKYYNEALKIYDSILEKNKTNSSVWYSKGVCLWNLKKYKDSRNCQFEAIKINPKNKAYWNELGDIAKITNKHDQAIVYYDKSIEIIPNSHAFVEKGRILYSNEKNEYGKAVSQFDQALKIALTTQTLIEKAYALYMSAIDEKQNNLFDDALDCFVEALKRDPKNANALGGKGNTLRLMKKYDDAIKNLNESIEIDPEDYWVYSRKFVTYQDMKKYDDAINFSNTILEKFPDKEEDTICNLLVGLYKEMGDEIKVKEYKEKCQKLKDWKTSNK